VQRLLALNLVAPDTDADATELACTRCNCPIAWVRAAVGKLGQVNLRDRAEQAAELLIGRRWRGRAGGNQIEEDLLDRTTRLLHELPHRSPCSTRRACWPMR